MIEANRLECFKFFHLGYSIQATASFVGISYRQARKFKQEYQNGGCTKPLCATAEASRAN